MHTPSFDSSADHDAILDFSAIARRYPQGVVLPQAFQETAQALSRLTDIPVLIHGETGTGKGILAKQIAQLRRQREGNTPFVSLNCAVLNGDVADAMVFGCRRGAYTGAHDHSIGAVGEAEGGVLFLDEIHCLSIGTQRKLLRLLDEGCYTRVGESTERQGHFQLVVASNQNLHRLVERGEFLLDLFMRIQGIELALPPLRDRRHDMADLIALYCCQHDLRIRRDDFQQLVACCTPLRWPGNIRQLYKALDTMRFKAAMVGDGLFAPHFIATAAMRDPLNGSDATLYADGRPEAQPINALVREILKVLERPIDLPRLLETVESTLISYALNRNPSINDAMDHLNLSRGKLDFKRRKYKLMDDTPAFAEGV